MEKYEEYKGYYYKIIQDDFAESPGEWGNDFAFLIYQHRQFTVKKEGYNPTEIYSRLSGNLDTYPYDEEYYIYPVYAYIHSGVRLSLSNNSDNWDTSYSGFILVSKEANNPTVIAEDLINTWNMYLSGEVYCYTIYNKIICDKCNHVEYEEIESCYGFYGYEDCENEVKQFINKFYES